MAWLIGLLLASSLTVEVDAGVHVPNAPSADKVNTAILHTAGRPGPSFLLFGFPKCGTTTLWAWITQHPKIKVLKGKEIHSLDNADMPRGVGQIDYDGWQPEARFASKLPSSLAADEVSGDGTPWYSV